MDHIKVVSYAKDTIRLKADAFFENTNDVGGKIKTDNLKVFINGEEVAEIFSEDFRVPAKATFSVPLQAAIPVKKIFNSQKNGILEGLIRSVLNKKIKVQFKGNLNYVVLGFQRDFLIDKTEEVKIKF
ncbi:MAG: hypothetical protein ACWIPJ_07000 [Polaribacter sp.]